MGCLSVWHFCKQVLPRACFSLNLVLLLEKDVQVVSAMNEEAGSHGGYW